MRKRQEPDSDFSRGRICSDLRVSLRGEQGALEHHRCRTILGFYRPPNGNAVDALLGFRLHVSS